MLKVANNSVKNGLAAAALAVACSAQVSLAGYTSVLSNNVGQVSASLAYSVNTNKAITAFPITNPSAGVTRVGTWTVQTNQPLGSPTICTSTVQVLNLFGYKAVAKAYTTTGVSADPSIEFSKKLQTDGYILVPNPCGSGYTLASGDETINGQRYLVVLGNATGGAAAWFRGYFFPNGPPPDRDTLIETGIKLFDVVVEGPFNFGDINSSDRCNALKIPIAYTGPNLYLVSDGATVSTTDLAIVNCPGNLTLCGNPAYPANITTTGGCGAANITFNPPASALPFGTSNVTATATDAAGNVATCNFTVTRPYLTLGSSGFANPINGIGGSCTAPLRQVKGAGNNLPIKFSTYSCNTIYNSTTPPTVTITKLFDPSDTIHPPCTPSQVEINKQKLALTSSQWHWQWQTLPTDVGYFQISVDLGDGNPNPISAIVQLTP